MNNTSQESKCLASLAVFRELYNSEKDVYGIIAAFLVDIIISNHKYTFNLTEITNLLNNSFDFTIPEAVVKTSVKRIKSIKKDKGQYFLDDLHSLKSLNINSKQEKIQNNNDEILDSLLAFVSQHKNEPLSSDEKRNIINSFISFLIDGTNGNKYSEFISAFIISKKEDHNFKHQLSTIKEGVVLYSGIKYNTNLSDLGSWHSDLTIFIDTEILFHLAGYNGDIFQHLWNDFYDYVKEINRNNNNKIKLKYFEDVQSEIDNFFKKAEAIVNGELKANPKITAMKSIVNGCSSKADIVSKKADFYRQLKLANINKDSFQNYYLQEYHKYNIEDQEVIHSISSKYGIDDPSPYLRFLNYVSIHRKDANENNFDNIGYILLSGNSKTIQIAWDDRIKQYGQVPLATTLNFLTSKFWFKLNKGFGKDNFPLTFDVITKAQIILANQINESVGNKFDELQRKYEDGSITEDQAKATIITLRKQARKPEDITKDDLNSILDDISEESIEAYIKDQEHSKLRTLQIDQENKDLKTKLILTENEVSNKIKKADALNAKLLEKNLQLLEEKKEHLDSLRKQECEIEKEITNKFSSFKVIISFVILLLFLIIVSTVLSLGWDITEPYTWMLSLLPILISILYMIYKEKTINPLLFLEARKDKIRQDIYQKFHFDSTRISKLKSEIEQIENK